MYWLKGTSRITTPSIPAYTIGTDLDFTLTLTTETGEDLAGAYLFVADVSHAGLLQAKSSTDSEYQEIREPFDATCFLGYIAAETQTDIDFRVSFPEGASDGYRVITILVGHDDGAERANPYFVGEWEYVWLDSWDEHLWSEEW